MATALSIWDWLSPATGAGLVGEGGADGFCADGFCVGDAVVRGGLVGGAVVRGGLVGGAVVGGGLVGAAVVGGGLSGGGVVRVWLRDASVSLVAARSASPASTGPATVAACGLRVGEAFAEETTFHEATPIPVSAMLATTPPTSGRIFDLCLWWP
jgi:hypothetical protein